MQLNSRLIVVTPARRFDDDSTATSLSPSYMSLDIFAPAEKKSVAFQLAENDNLAPSQYNSVYIATPGRSPSAT